MTHLEHGHGRDHAYVLAGESSPHTAPTTLGHGHGGPHAYVTAGSDREVRLAGLGPKINSGTCTCCSGTGEHKCGHECYRCDASGENEPGKPPCEGHHGRPDTDLTRFHINEKTAASKSLYHGTSVSGLTRVLPAARHGRETFGGLSSPEHAYATGDLVQARQYADLSTMIHGGNPRVYEVRHAGPEHDLEPDPGYAPDVRSRHGFHVVRELAPEELPASRFSAAVGSRRAQVKCSARPISTLTAPPILSIAFMPTKRLFGPTYGLDKRLFDGDHLKGDVRRYIYETLATFWKGKHGVDWDEWAIIYLAGSEASEWTSEERIGNNDFDVLVGVDYDKFRGAHARREAGKTDQEITDELNADFRTLNQRTAQAYIEIDGKFEGPFSNTWYVNPDSYDIRKIKPYAAYDVTNMRWAVKPPHLPKWDISQFPEGPALVAECQAVSAYVRAILNMPEPYRTQQGYALWHHLHSDRARAFGPQGEGWFDPGNVLEKFLDQQGLWEKLVEIMVRVHNDSSTMNAPKDWSNTPVG